MPTPHTVYARVRVCVCVLYKECVYMRVRVCACGVRVRVCVCVRNEGDTKKNFC